MNMLKIYVKGCNSAKIKNDLHWSSSGPNYFQHLAQSDVDRRRIYSKTKTFTDGRTPRGITSYDHVFTQIYIDVILGPGSNTMVN